MQKAQGYVKGCTTPNFHRKHLIAVVAGITLGDFHQVVGTHPGSQQRLVTIAKSGIGILDAGFVFQPLDKTFTPQFFQAVFAAFGVSFVMVVFWYHRIQQDHIRIFE